MKVPQHLELDDVVAFGLGMVDLVVLAAGLTLGWWCALVLADTLVLRLCVAAPFVVAGALLGIVRVGDCALRTWALLALAYAARPRLLVTGTC